MDDLHFALLPGSLALACVAAALVGRRRGEAPRDLRLLLAAGATLGGLSLLILSLRDLA